MATGNTISSNVGTYKCLIHIDRLSLTFLHYSGSTFQNRRNPDFIPEEQSYGNIVLRYENSPGIGAYYHTYSVYYSGWKVGRLHAGSKMRKPDLQFDFEKETFYSFRPDFWFDVYSALKDELGILPNNINYLEIAADTDKNLLNEFTHLYQNAENNHLRMNSHFRMKKGTQVHVMSNGSSFVIAGTENEVVIYNKSAHAEKYIQEYFENNGFSGCTVYRIECRLKWNYLRYLRNTKHLNIDIESLLHPGKLATIFRISINHKTTFVDLQSKSFDQNRNPSYNKINIIDDLPLEIAEIGNLSSVPGNSHYKTETTDENIIRQNYYRFLETANPEYFRIFKASCAVAGFNRNKIANFINKFNSNYRGNRTTDVLERMEYAHHYFSSKHVFQVKEFLASIGVKLKLYLMSMF